MFTPEGELADRDESPVLADRGRHLAVAKMSADNYLFAAALADGQGVPGIDASLGHSVGIGWLAAESLPGGRKASPIV